MSNAVVMCLLWSTGKPPDNAQQFSQMLDIDEIDRSINAINKDVREGQQAVNTLEDNLLLSKQKLDALGWVVDEAMEEFKHLETLNATIVLSNLGGSL